MGGVRLKAQIILCVASLHTSISLHTRINPGLKVVFILSHTVLNYLLRTKMRIRKPKVVTFEVRHQYRHWIEMKVQRRRYQQEHANRIAKLFEELNNDT